MNDPRVLNLAKILVRYSTQVGEGDTCLIEGPTAAEPLIAAVYDEVFKAGGQPVLAMAFDSQPESFYRLASDAQLEWISPRLQVGGRGGRLPHRHRRGREHPRALVHSARPPDQAPGGHPRAHRARDEALGRGRAQLGLHALSHERLRVRRRDEPRRVRGLLLRRLPGRLGRSARARGRRRRARPGASPSTSRGTRRSTSPARAQTSASASRAAPSSPASATATCPTASSSRARSRTRSKASSHSTCPRWSPGARSRASASASRPARSSTRRPSAARSS